MKSLIDGKSMTEASYELFFIIGTVTLLVTLFNNINFYLKDRCLKEEYHSMIFTGYVGGCGLLFLGGIFWAIHS